MSWKEHKFCKRKDLVWKDGPAALDPVKLLNLSVSSSIKLDHVIWNNLHANGQGLSTVAE